MAKPTIRCITMLLGVLMSMSIFNSCENNYKKLVGHSYNPEAISNEHIVQLVEYINDNNVDGVRAAFSAQTVKDTQNFDEQLQKLMQFFSSGIEIKELRGCSVAEEWDKDANYYSSETSGSCIITDGTNEYELSFTECLIDNNNTDRIGFMLMIVCDITADRNEVSEWLYSNHITSTGIWIYPTSK